MYGLRGPCKGCPLRKVGCHAVCLKYRQYRAMMDKASEEARRERIKDASFSRAFFKERTGWR